MTKEEFTDEYKRKLDFLMQETDNPKVKEIIAKLYGLSQESGESLLNAVKAGIF